MATEGPLTAAEIYEQITNGEGPGKLEAARDAATTLRHEFEASADMVAKLAGQIDSGWQGEGGSAAANAAWPLAKASDVDSKYLDIADRAVTDQISAFGTVSNSVVPVSADPPAITADDFVSFMQGENSYQAKLDQYNAESQANVQAFAAYHQASTANGETMPASYASLADLGAPVSLIDSGTGREATAARDTAPAPIVGGVQRAPVTGGSVGSPQGTPIGSTATPIGQTGSQTGNTPDGDTSSNTGGTPADDGTHAAAYRPQPVNPPVTSQPDYQFGPTGKPINHLNTGTGPWAPPNPYTGYAPAPGAGPRPGTGAGTGTGTGNGFARLPGATPGTPGAPGQGGQVAPPPGRGTGAGIPGETAARCGTAPGTGANARGATGMPMGAVGGGRGKEEDKERTPPAYLRNPDPDETFAGPVEKTTPPVLGERKTH
ncbi:hypothetical protein [Prauserella flavalba]|uniref:hypothetical protein n=1 Tax=Prauserella flavalba TaxID=1477506 RepID=UPI0036E6CB26